MPSATPTISIADSLVERFQDTFDGPPEWAWQIEPSIPLIGRRFRPGRGILVYASAENFSWLNRTYIPPWLKPPDSWNRYRVQYEEKGRTAATFFPYVGIQPVSDGGLLAAAWFVAKRLGLPASAEPREFLETIAVSNWCKFTIQSETNQDNLSLSKLVLSLPFVVGELAELRPGVVMVPTGVWRWPVMRAAMRGASPRTRFVPIPQFNGRVINSHLGKFQGAARGLRDRMSGTPLSTWMSNLKRLNKDNAWRYIAYLDREITALAITSGRRGLDVHGDTGH